MNHYDQVLDQIADDFESAWQDSVETGPELAEFLKLVEPSLVSRLAELLIPLDIEFRLKAGESVAAGDYGDLIDGGESIAQRALESSNFEVDNLDEARDMGSKPVEANKQAQHREAEPEGSASDRPLSTHRTKSQTIGPYKLLQRIGAGGMGEVWVAEQAEPVKRRVALKLIKAGIGSKEIIARFDAERQALALMNHPNIARILDAGTTPDGQPFFAMELVQGKPLTTYCDENRLSIDERLELFADVCSGVQHAHQKGIIHRDLKPENILVAVADGQAVPKVIDFGLAKALESTQRLTDQSLFTGIGQILGTLKYMSPEQASLDNLDIDTRTDIYALGVILYKLLTGSTPLDDSSLKGQTALKVLEIIREKEPVKPSSRLGSSTDEQVSTITGQRKTDSVRLNRVLAGDLDWIVMKALEKDRTRRYESASGFAADIRRYLNGEPVVARPPSLNYRVRKFVKKNRVGVLAAGLLLLALTAGIVGTTLAMFRALAAESLAENRLDEANEARAKEAAQRKVAEDQRLIAEDRRTEAEGQRAAAQQAQANAEQAQARAETAAVSERLARLEEQRQRKFAEAINDFVKNDFLALTSVKGQTRFGETDEMGLDRNTTLFQLLDRAAEKLTQRKDLDPLIEAELSWIVGVNFRGAGAYDRAIPFLERAVALRIELLGADDERVLDAQNSLAVAYSTAGQLDKALLLLEQTLELMKAKLGPEHPHTLISMNNLADGYRSTGQLNKALPLLEQTLELMKVKLGPEHPHTLTSMNNLADGYREAGQLDKALPLLKQTLELKKAILGPEHLDTLTSMAILADGYRSIGQLDNALPLYEQTLELKKTILGPEHPDTVTSMANLGFGYHDAGQLDKALPLLEQTLELRKTILGPEHPDTLTSMGSLAEGYRSTGQLDKALPLLEQTLELMKVKLGSDHPATLQSKNNLAAGYREAGQLDIALSLLEQTLEFRDAKLGPDHPDTLTSMANLAEGYREAGRLDKALPMLEQTLELRDAKLGPDHPDTLTSMNNLALGYYDAGQLDKALSLLEQTLELSKAKLGPDHPDTLNSMANLAEGYCAADQLDNALPLWEQTLELRKAKLGPDHPHTLTSMNNLAAGYWSLQQLDKSVPLFEELLPLLERKLGRGHPNTQLTVANLGVNLRDAGRVAEAIPLLEEAYRASKQTPTLRWVGSQLLDAYANADKLAEARKLMEEMLVDARRDLPPDSPQLAGQLAEFGLSLLEMNGYAAAEPLLRECLAIREKYQAEDWTTCETQSMLGGALLGQAKYAEAEPLLLKGYEGMKAREESIPPQATRYVTTALDRLIELYTLLDKPEEIEKYRELRAAYPLVREDEKK
ncbi:MAG TPA: tetratricopeptide repeat protein [Pirellulaceae bacterium]|nr:tetratricopeptide repeat protein [Pirellulaceae bacterium]